MNKGISILLLIISMLPGLAQVKAPEPYGAIPSERQISWHEMDMYVLVHFTPTTFEDKEWGFGDADPKIFNPTQFDAAQIIKAVKAGGFRGLILVSKHHDGFARLQLLTISARAPGAMERAIW
jgi:alpha-L-fucosidase